MNSISKSIRLLTLDAFGTLYIPKELIGSQYVHVASRHGLEGLQHSVADVDQSFREGEPPQHHKKPRPETEWKQEQSLTWWDGAVFRIESKERPNYGKAVGMNPSEWWANVGGFLTYMQ